MSKLIVLKIGGSVCTEKEKGKFKIRSAVIRRIAKEIKKAQKKKGFQLVVVHGAGPFGHVLVEKYKINNGVRTEREWKGFVKTINSMRFLRERIAEELTKCGLMVYPIAPITIIEQKNKKLKKFDLGVVEKILGFEDTIPLLSGDMVFDTALGASVISGDMIASYLGKRLGAEKVLFGTNVEGILDTNKKVIKRIDEKNYVKVCKEIYGAKSTDVTGGMKGKIEKIRQMDKGIKVIVFNMNKENNTYNLLIGKKGIGTEIRF